VPSMFSLVAELLSPDVSGLNLGPIDDPGASPPPGFSSGSTSSSLPAPGWASPEDLDVISSKGGEASPHPVSSTGRTSSLLPADGWASLGDMLLLPSNVEASPPPPRDAPQER
jgi:hypothetical protein